uniref:Rapamycin-insensitive companion of mTOR domain-containing protein n=1 Tax=Clastoptera arizonana TaxID=38151 RepID=A0A1B6C0I0_9HEMI
MAVTSWMWAVRGRGIRLNKITKGRVDGEDEDVQLDWSKDCAGNIREVLCNICKKQGISVGRKLGYLNAFVKLLVKYENDFNSYGFTPEEILFCLRPALVHETTQVRAGSLRALRYFVRRKEEVAICIKLQYPILIARSLDLLVGNDTERIQAVRVIRRLLILNPENFPVILVRAILSVPASVGEDRLLNACLAVLTEICILNPDLFIACGGVAVVLRNLTSVKSARMAEALIGSLLYLLNKPNTRLKARLNLDCLAAPFTDLHSVDKFRDTGQSNESRLKWPHVILLSMLRSWPGVLHFCHPEKEGLRSIVATLYLNQFEVRKAVLDLLYELLCLAQPEWSDEMSVALEAVDPSRSQESFRLAEGFVAAEGRAVLTNLSKCRVNLSEVHLSLLLYSFLEVGLLDAIVEVIITEDTFLSVRSTILLGELLHLIHLLLPPECCHLTPALPNLLSYAVRGRPTSCEKPLLMSKSVNHKDLEFEESLQVKSDCKQNLFLQDEGVKDSNLTNRLSLSLQSECSSARTISESSADKILKSENALKNITESSLNDSQTMSSELQDSIPIPATNELLTDLREDFFDLPATSNVKSPTQPKLKFKVFEGPFCNSDVEYIPEQNSLKFNVDPPYCSRSQQRALASVSALSKLHRLLRKRPAPSSIFLDHVLTSVDCKEPLEALELARIKGKTSSKNKLSQALNKECEDAIRESGVLTVKDCFAWNWEVVRSILKSRPDCFKRVEDHNQKLFLRRLVQFITPSARQLSRIEIGTDRRTANVFTLVACELMECLLLGSNESECEKLLMDFLLVLKAEFNSILTSKSAHDCLLSPQNVTTTLCQDYFLLVGRLSRTEAGLAVLEKSGILQVLLELSVTTNHDCYVKLIISTLNYSIDGMTRTIMTKVLSCKQVPSRLFATKFLHVLLRTPIRKHKDYFTWVIEILVNQLYDENKTVSLAAINALDEACDCKEYLETMINVRPSLLHLGDQGLLLLIKFLSLPQGFSYLNEANFVTKQLQKWATHYNYRYVCIVEGLLCDALTLVEKNEDGRYSSRLSNNKHTPGDVYVPPHLYGQLCQLEEGFKILIEDDNISRLCQIIFHGLHNSDNEILELKSALWAIGHITTSVYGAQWSIEHGMTKAIVQLAQNCPVYSVRAAAFYSLSLTATNKTGADILRSVGWHTVRHNRHDRWPVVESLAFLEEVLYKNTFHEERSEARDSIKSNDTNVEQISKGGLFFLPEDETVEADDFLSGFTVKERVFQERKSATLPPTGVPPLYHHNRSYSESKADTDYPPSTSPTYSNSGIDMHDLGDRGMHYVSPVLNTSCFTAEKSHQRKTSTFSNYSGQAGITLNLSSQDALGYAKLRSLNRGRRPPLSPTPSLSLAFSSYNQVNLSPLSPIELLAFQDWKQMSPLVRPKHCENQPLSSEFEARGIRWPLLSDAVAARTLHYESSRSFITDSPDHDNGEDLTSYGPCYLGICLPQNLSVLFPELEPKKQI